VPVDQGAGETVLVVRPPLRVAAILSTFIGAMSAASWWIAITQGRFVGAAWLTTAALACWNLWVWAFEIRVSEARLSMRSLFGGTRVVDVRRIDNVTVGDAERLASVLFSSGQELVVHVDDGTKLAINAAVFDGRDLARVRSTLESARASRVSRR
jgi:hypothetical protein